MLVHYSWKANPHGRGDRAGSRGRRGRAGVGREVRRVSSPPLLRLRRLRGRLTTQGSRRGPVNERVRTRTDSVACERKPAGHRPTEATPQVSEAGPPTFFFPRWGSRVRIPSSALRTGALTSRFS
jgi:hypothetical protein